MTDTPERRRMHPEVEHLLLAIQSRDDAITALRGDVQMMPERIGDAIQRARPFSRAGRTQSSSATASRRWQATRRRR